MVVEVGVDPSRGQVMHAADFTMVLGFFMCTGMLGVLIMIWLVWDLR